MILKLSRFFDLVSWSVIVWILSVSMSLKTHFVRGLNSALAYLTSVIERSLSSQRRA